MTAETKRFEITEQELVYATHDGVELRAVLFQPKGGGPHPGIVAYHGGGQRVVGDPRLYAPTGRYLASHGYAVLSATYRQSIKARPMWRETVIDCAYAVRYLRGRAAELNVSPDRIGVMGGSAGARVAALVALAAHHPAFASPYRDDPYHAVDAAVRTVVYAYGSGDTIARWRHQARTQPPHKQNLEEWLGGTPVDVREAFYLFSPTYHCSIQNAGHIKWQVIWGTGDHLTNPGGAAAFVEDLGLTGAFVDPMPVTDAPHGFLNQTAADEPNSWNARVFPRILWFLDRYLRGVSSDPGTA